MAKKEKSGPSWADVKKAIEIHGRDELIKLVADLYRLSKTNRSFLHARFSIGDDPLKPYKKTIANSIFPGIHSKKPIQLSHAKAVIADYKKAGGDPLGVVELMVYFVEIGTQVCCAYGGMPDWFCSPVVDTYRLAIKNVKKLPEASRQPFIDRLEKIMLSAEKAGWSYQDDVAELFDDAFGEAED